MFLSKIALKKINGFKLGASNGFKLIPNSHSFPYILQTMLVSKYKCCQEIYCTMSRSIINKQKSIFE